MTSQRPELKNQVSAMKNFCLARGLSVTEWITEIGGELNLKRQKFLQLMLSILQGELSTIVVAHKDKDRLCRFAFALSEQLAFFVNCEIIVANKAN